MHCVNLAARGRRPLKQASIPLVPMQVCRRRDWLGAEFTLTDRMMCAGYEHGGVDTCQACSTSLLLFFNICCNWHMYKVHSSLVTVTFISPSYIVKLISLQWPARPESSVHIIFWLRIWYFHSGNWLYCVRLFQFNIHPKYSRRPLQAVAVLHRGRDTGPKIVARPQIFISNRRIGLTL